LFGAVCANLTPSGAPLHHVVEVDGAV
jgi:hypothetical protein